MGRFWSVGGGGLLLMTDLKGHGCARSVKFFKSCKLSKLRAGHKNQVKPSEFIFNMHGNARTDIITSSMPWAQ